MAGFIGAQLIGLLVGVGLLLAPYPNVGAASGEVVVEQIADEPARIA